jgi:hypothetical protein
LKKLFTERYGMALPRTGEKLNAEASTALLSLVSARIDENWFGERFPELSQTDRSTSVPTR